MQRRDLLLSAAVATGAVAAGTTAKAADKPPREIRTRDGVKLFHQDWGSGKPVVFVSAWGLSSRMWTYRAAHLGGH